MHLALIGPWPPFRGGIAHFTSRLARALQGRGHQISGVSFSRQYPSLLFPGRSQVEPGDAPADLPAAPRLLDTLDPVSWWKVANHLRRLRPDALVFQHWMPFFCPAYGTVARRVLHTEGRRPRRLAVVHNALPHERRPADVALSRYFLRACDGLVTLSESVRRDLEHLVPDVAVEERAHPVYDQFGTAAPRAEARRALGLPDEAPVLLFFGFIRRYKGLDVLLDALATVARHHPDVVLLVAGEFYEAEAEYRRQIAALGLEQHVRIENRYIPAQEVPLIFGAADVVVQPYRTATQSGVAQAAVGFGVPVITTDVGGLSEAVPHEQAGLVVPPQDPGGLAAAVIRYLGDAELRARLADGTSQLSDKSGWDDLCEAIELFLPTDDTNTRDQP